VKYGFVKPFRKQPWEIMSRQSIDAGKQQTLMTLSDAAENAWLLMEQKMSISTTSFESMAWAMACEIYLQGMTAVVRSGDGQTDRCRTQVASAPMAWGTVEGEEARIRRPS
jgi:hypothetical protein